MNRINIFIPVYHRGRTVRKAMDAILKTYKSDGYDVRLVIVDNGSGKGLRDYLTEVAKGCDDVRLELLSSNKGKGPAINMAAKKHNDFEWFINCDSDILPMVSGWPGLLAECYSKLPGAGMISVEYVSNGNNPMPKQPNKREVMARDGKHVFHWGGQVAGGCFITDAGVWNNIGYRCSGVYGGVDGIFRQNVAESLKRKCGFVTGIMAEHLDDRVDNEEYHKWKIDVQNKIRKLSPLAKAKDLGNDKGFWD